MVSSLFGFVCLEVLDFIIYNGLFCLLYSGLDARVAQNVEFPMSAHRKISKKCLLCLARGSGKWAEGLGDRIIFILFFRLQMNTNKEAVPPSSLQWCGTLAVSLHLHQWIPATELSPFPSLLSQGGASWRIGSPGTPHPPWGSLEVQCQHSKNFEVALPWASHWPLGERWTGTVLQRTLNAKWTLHSPCTWIRNYNLLLTGWPPTEINNYMNTNPDDVNRIQKLRM